MRVIVSHDVDHLGALEHLWDGILAKFAVRSLLELVDGRIPLQEAARRASSLVSGRWHNLDELMDFDETRGVPSTFFFGMAKGLGMSYGADAAAPWIRKVESRGFSTGVHGVEYQNETGIREEKTRFEEITSNKAFGIRMHYLRLDPGTHEKLAAAGYAFDGTPYGIGDPWKVDDMPVFPVHMMDGRYLESGRFGVQVRDYSAVLERTKAAIRKEADSGTRFFSLLFHDRYFSDQFGTWKRWYQDTLDFLSAEGHTFQGYDEAIKS